MKIVTLYSVLYHFAECHSAERNSLYCHYLGVTLQSVVMPCYSAICHSADSHFEAYFFLS